MSVYNALSPSPTIPPSWRQLLRQMEHLAQFGGGVQVISGAQGAGKSTFLHEFTQQSSHGQQLILWTVIEEAWPGQALQNLLTALSIPVESGQSIGQSIVALRHFAQHLQRERQRVIVAVDDSDLLSDACLAGIVSVLQGAGEEGVGLHLVFFTQRSLAARLDRLQLIDVTVYDFELPSFTLPETTDLLNTYYSQIVQREAIAALTEIEVEDIWHSSQGMPGVAVTMAKEKWALGLLGKKRFFVKGFPLVHTLAAVALVGALGWVLWGREKPAQDTAIVTNLTPQVAPAPTAAIEMKKITPPTDTQEPARPESPEAALAAQIAHTQALKDAQQAPAPETPSAPPAPHKTEAATADTAKAEAPKAETAKPETLKAETAKTDPAKTKADPNKAEPPKAEPVKTEIAKTEAAAKPAKPEAVKAETAKTPVAKVEAPKAETPKASPKASAVSDTLDAKKLAALPASSFVLQLMYSTSLKKLQDTQAAAANKKDLSIYHTVREGKDVYILVAGLYPNANAAAAGVAQLPASQQAGKPWPKKLTLVHEELKAGRP